MLAAILCLSSVSCRKRKKSNNQNTPPPLSQPSPIPSADIPKTVPNISFGGHCPLGPDTTEASTRILPSDALVTWNESFKLPVQVLKKGLIPGSYSNARNYRLSFDVGGTSPSSAVTDQSGMALLSLQAYEQTTNPICVSIRGDVSTSVGRVFVSNPKDSLVVVLIDDVFENTTAKAFSEKKSVGVTANSLAVKAIDELASKYRIVYISLLEESMGPVLKRWIKSNSLPPGPVYLWDDSYGSIQSSALGADFTFVSAVTRKLKSKFTRVFAGISTQTRVGNAFVAAGIDGYFVSSGTSTVSGLQAKRLMSWSDASLIKP